MRVGNIAPVHRHPRAQARSRHAGHQTFIRRQSQGTSYTDWSGRWRMYGDAVPPAVVRIGGVDDDLGDVAGARHRVQQPSHGLIIGRRP